MHPDTLYGMRCLNLIHKYEGFKKAYQEAAKPDYIDLDKDGNKTEPMKKAAKDKEAKEKEAK